jgi:hypothetical protein
MTNNRADEQVSPVRPAGRSDTGAAGQARGAPVALPWLHVLACDRRDGHGVGEWSSAVPDEVTTAGWAGRSDDRWVSSAYGPVVAGLDPVLAEERASLAVAADDLELGDFGLVPEQVRLQRHVEDLHAMLRDAEDVLATETGQALARFQGRALAGVDEARARQETVWEVAASAGGQSAEFRVAEDQQALRHAAAELTEATHRGVGIESARLRWAIATRLYALSRLEAQLGGAADAAIGLFLQYRDTRGYDLERAAARAETAAIEAINGVEAVIDIGCHQGEQYYAEASAVDGDEPFATGRAVMSLTSSDGEEQVLTLSRVSASLSEVIQAGRRFGHERGWW